MHQLLSAQDIDIGAIPSKIWKSALLTWYAGLESQRYKGQSEFGNVQDCHRA